MPKEELKDRLEKGVFFLDGAMGTQLFKQGVKSDRCSEELNIDSPNIVLEIHKAYIQAGSNGVLTNTFGASEIALKRHGLDKEMHNLNQAGALVAAKAVGEQGYVIGDIGPCGDFLEPLGSVKEEDLIDVFAAQAQALNQGGVDGYMIETMTALNEVTAAIKAIQSLKTDKPIFVSMAYDYANGEFNTMMGQNYESAIKEIISYNVEAVGFNCGKMSLDNYIELSRKFSACVSGEDCSCKIMAELNAGLPELVDGKPTYKVQPDDFAQAAEEVQKNGVDIIGGCCGTTPEHIKAMTRRLLKH
jgi:5-methyltetrahydrofolate--homocysteine methyltransferase